MLKRLAASIREYKKASILTPCLIIGEVLMECLIPFITAKLVNEIKSGCDLKVIAGYGGILVLMALISLSFGYLAGRYCAVASAGFAKNLRHDLFARVQTFSFENIDRFSASSLVTRLTTDVMYVQEAFMMIIRTAIRSPLMLIFSFTMAFVMGGKMAFVFVVIAPVLIIALLLIIRKTMPLFHAVFKKYDALNESIQENIIGMRVIKAFVREDFEQVKFQKASGGVRDDFEKAEKILALNNPLMQICLNLDMVLILFFGSYTIITSMGVDLDVGQFSALMTYGFQIMSSLMMLSMIFVILTLSVESASRICEVLKEESTIKAPENAVTEVKDGSIDFDAVSFKYSLTAERYALEGIDLHIRSGETIGIIGGTGSSKTTLIQLISRLYDVSQGRVCVGGVDVREYDPEVLRNEVAVVLQKNVLFSGTIKDNLRWGKQDATDEEMIEACRLACADEFITTFPKGYDTFIEQGGSNVSGGQKQRLCIARALLKHPKVLILDDSTSAVDTKTDARIRAAFAKYLPDTTKLIIAQRIASVQDADRILVLSGGKIDRIGTHEELLVTSDIYREVYESQVKGGNTDEETA